MKPAPFAYAKARSVAHAIELLVDDDARLLAGGQSLIATLNMRLSHPALLVDINGVGGLDRIASNNGHIEIGALVRHAQAERSPELARRAPLIALAMPHIGHPAIRNRGTIGGSIAFADPAAELPACVLALGGELDDRRAAGHPASSRPTISSRACSRPRLPPVTCLPPSASPPPAPTRASASPSSRAATATMPWWDWPPARGPTAKRLRDVRLAYFGVGLHAGARTSCGAGADRAATSTRRCMRSRRISNPPDDVQASGAVKTHLAGVLLRRVARQLDQAPS